MTIQHVFVRVGGLGSHISKTDIDSSRYSAPNLQLSQTHAQWCLYHTNDGANENF